MNRRQTIHDLPAEERPRERLLRLGAAALSGTELLAILLRTGGGGRDVLEASAALLAGCGGLAGLAGLGVEELLALPGIGPAKAAALAASLELGRRTAEASVGTAPVLDRPEAVAACLVSRLRGRPTEAFGYLALDGRHRLLRIRELSSGTRRHAPVDAAELFRRALLDGASGLLLFHNHPSGVLEPSADDRLLTRRLVEAGSAIGLPVLDHLIVAGPAWISLRAEQPDLFVPRAPGSRQTGDAGGPGPPV